LIEGEAGVGYILRPGFLLPPLSFTEDEIQALVAGAQWVSRQTDPALVDGARNALAKIGGVVPPEMRRVLEDDMFYVGDAPTGSGLDLGRVRRAIREQRKMRLLYTDQGGETAERMVWPLVLGFVESRWSIAAWCERRETFRIFLAARIRSADFVDERYPGNRRQLTKEWYSMCHLPMERSVE
jgi:predicted DNA-binding transcriptional regulator YafY